MVPVSSDTPDHRVIAELATREAYEQLKSLWDQDDHAMSHSRSPACVVSMEKNRPIWIFKIYDSKDKLVAYFPYEEKKLFGIRIIRPAFFELTLDFIDIAYLSNWKDFVADIFYDWIELQEDVVLDLFMCSEESVLVRVGLERGNYLVQARGKYLFADLPGDFENFLMGLSRSTRMDARKTLRLFESKVNFEVVESPALGDELANAICDLVRLHKNVFPDNSSMLPHLDALTRYLEKAFSDDCVLFVGAREVASGELVASNLFAKSNKALGLIQNGRKVDPQFNKIGIWLMLKSVEWAVNSGLNRIEFFFGDQEYKRRLSTSERDAVSVTYFSNQKVRYIYRIRQRLGRYFKSLR